jgi:predicted MFS family arabinose efflux permease
MDAAPRPVLERDAVTRLVYLMLGLWGFLLYALGPALPALRDDLEVSRAAVGLHTTFVALGAIAVGALGDRVVVRLGRRRAFWTAAACLAGGALLLAGGTVLAVTLTGSALLGLSGALIVVLVQSTLADRHGGLGAAALLEANALATGLGAAAPFVVALAIVAGSSWRAVFAGVAILALPALALAYRAVEFPPPVPVHATGSGRLPASYWTLWAALLAFIAAEFCIAFWSTDYLQSEHELRPSTAAASASLFLVGMTAGRLAGGRLARRLPGTWLLAGALAVAAAAFTGFWLLPAAAGVVAALALTGLGVSVLYPVTLSLALDTAAGRTDAASARAAFASGFAIAIAPFALGALADASGLRAAYGIVPVLLAAGAILLRTALSRGRPERARRA